MSGSVPAAAAEAAPFVPRAGSAAMRGAAVAGDLPATASGARPFVPGGAGAREVRSAGAPSARGWRARARAPALVRPAAAGAPAQLRAGAAERGAHASSAD